MKHTHVLVPIQYLQDRITELENKIADPNTRDNIELEYEGSIYAYEHILQIGVQVSVQSENEISFEELKTEKKIAGYLTKPFGIKGYHRAEIDHIIYDEGDRYIIYLTHDTLPVMRVPFYKEDFKSIRLHEQ